ncbi:hypothetical protein B0H14DRAFT_2788960 [Mycena olivaceomarginata]|nr:hypothetical protein B0H14DRAFT_2788960 [Mycena olivaceomarginata]
MNARTIVAVGGVSHVLPACLAVRLREAQVLLQVAVGGRGGFGGSSREVGTSPSRCRSFCTLRASIVLPMKIID